MIINNNDSLKGENLTSCFETLIDIFVYATKILALHFHKLQKNLKDYGYEIYIFRKSVERPFSG